jgi:hypothetical protein
MVIEKKDKDLLRWEEEGGALPCGPQEAVEAACDKRDSSERSDASNVTPDSAEMKKLACHDESRRSPFTLIPCN